MQISYNIMHYIQFKESPCCIEYCSIENMILTTHCSMPKIALLRHFTMRHHWKPDQYVKPTPLVPGEANYAFYK